MAGAGVEVRGAHKAADGRSRPAFCGRRSLCVAYCSAAGQRCLRVAGASVAQTSASRCREVPWATVGGSFTPGASSACVDSAVSRRPSALRPANPCVAVPSKAACAQALPAAHCLSVSRQGGPPAQHSTANSTQHSTALQPPGASRASTGRSRAALRGTAHAETYTHALRGVRWVCAASAPRRHRARAARQPAAYEHIRSHKRLPFTPPVTFLHRTHAVQASRIAPGRPIWGSHGMAMARECWSEQRRTRPASPRQSCASMRTCSLKLAKRG
jgi:hypothetical protein